jgi:hypothetical protein
MLDGSGGLIIEPPVVDIIISTHQNLAGSAQDGLFALIPTEVAR